MYCDYNIERYVKNKYYDYLKNLDPEKYPDLVVRIGGYSLYFNRISRASKLESIERFEKEGF